MISARDICVSLGGKPIIRNVSLMARPGAVTVIVGPNGSGKTTMVRALSGDVVHSGEVRINGRDCGRLQAWQMAAMRAVLPQSTNLSFPFTVREIVGLGLTGGRSGIPAHRQAGAPERALERVDLAGFGGRFYQELSGGEQQRVQLARVLCQVWEPVLDGDPRWLFLDEPVSSLDIRHQLIIMEIAADFARRGGGVLAVLHDLNLTAMFADQVILMDRGRIVETGTPGVVFRDELVERVFGCALKVSTLPPLGMPYILPQSVGSAHRGGARSA
jgi:iron complex transport system ATP-binding protein